MVVKQLVPKNINIKQDRLTCIIERFERIKRHLSFSFYFFRYITTRYGISISCRTCT